MLGELFELYDWMLAATAGWRFVLQPSYRNQVLSGWKEKPWYRVTWEIICGLAGIAFSFLILFALVYIAWDLIKPFGF